MWVLVLGFFAFFFFNCFPWVLLSIIPQRQSDRPGREGVLVRNVKTMRVVYWVVLLARERRSSDMLSVKKEARLSARALAEVEVGRGEEDLRCKSLFIVYQRHRGLSEDEETRLA